MALFEDLEGIVDDIPLGELRRLTNAFLKTIKRLGEDPKEEVLVPLLEDYRDGVGEIEERYGFIGPEEAASIREWYEHLAAEHELCVVSLDDLDEPPSW